MEKTIPELVDRFVTGDDKAFAELVRRYQKKIYVLAFRMLGSHLDADEVVQESLVRVYRRRKELAGIENFTSFLIRIATNYAIDMLRKKRIQAEVTDEASDLLGPDQLSLADRTRTPDALYHDKQINLEIMRALDMLPPRQKTVVILHDVEGHSKSDIATMMDSPEATVRSNLHIARTKLRKILKSRLDDMEPR